MTDNIIKLNKNEVLKLIIKDENDEETGDYLEFDLEDIELPLKYQELVEKDKKNRQNIKNQFTIIERRQDVKGKKLMSKNTEDKIKALNDFFKQEEEVYNGFLGENGVKKLNHNRKLGWTTFDEIDEIITTQILPYLDLSLDRMTDKVKQKYPIKDDEKELK